MCFIKTNKLTDIGDPSESPGVETLLEVLEYGDLLDTVKKTHESQGHASVGTILRKASQNHWHPELILGTHEAICNCRSCQPMMSPDQSLGILRPIQPTPPLTRWGVNHTLIGQTILLNAVEYATGWLEPRLVSNADFTNTLSLLLYIIQKFGTPRQTITDNAS